MTLMCIERSQSPTHKGSFLQGGKAPVSNINQQNANQHRRSSCSPPLSKNHQDKSSTHKLERSSSDADRRSQSVAPSNSSRYKTELCRPFEENGTCKYGDKCQFAHGIKELRSMARHPKYKTELCRTFHSTGLCPYGPRCHFIHNSEQTKKSLLTHLTGSNSSSTRSKVLNSLGSTGDISPPSSHGGSPTDMKSFDDLYLQNPMSPPPELSNSAIDFTQEFANFVNSLNMRFADFPTRGYNSEMCDSVSVFSDGMAPDSSLDNYNYQSPLLDLFQTAPMTPLDANAGFFRLPIFDHFHKQ